MKKKQHGILLVLLQLAGSNKINTIIFPYIYIYVYKHLVNKKKINELKKTIKKKKK